MSTLMLQFAFGPVQSFVSQARTTRDLWAGSYLLSYLAGTAMTAALRTSQKIHLVTPSPDDPLLRALHRRKWPKPAS
ncbi:MAG: hypothetical protein IMW99_08205 [Firmicutes bacterium]|nr:hypothetical protein [Bacillota bacterium]